MDVPGVTRTVGRFELIRRIGRGGMAVVYLARQHGLDRYVALKELRTFDEAESSLAERFLREARVAGAMSHPNIVTVFDYFDEDGTPFIAMEYLPRLSLRPLMGRLTLAQAVGVLEGVLAALSHAESHQVVHRDLKPENLLITGDGTIKVADFGIAKAYNQVSMGLTGTGMAIGTPTYMAPEQAMAKEVGRWTDLYATGVIAYELLVGRVPFLETDTPLSILWQHVHDPIAPPRSLRPDLDPELAEWLERMLAKAPADRPANAAEAWESLEEIVVRLLGWRWRQGARLPQLDELPAPEPPAPEPVPETPTPPEPSGFETYAPAVDPPVETPPAEEPRPLSGGDPDAWHAPTEAPLPSFVDETHKSFEFPKTERRNALGRRIPWLAVGAAAAAAAGIAAAIVISRSGDPIPDTPTTADVLPDPAPVIRERVAVAVAGGSVFLALPRGQLVRLDASSLGLSRSAPDPAMPTSILSHAGALLVGDRDGVARVGATTFRRLATLGFTRAHVAGGDGAPVVVSGALAGGRGRVCVLRSLEAAACARLPFVPSGLGAARGGSVFAADRATGTLVLLRLDRGKLVTTRRVELGANALPHGRILALVGRLYVPVRRGVAVVDRATGRLVQRIGLGTTPTEIWIVPYNRRLFAPLYGRDAVAVVDLTAATPRPTFVEAGKRPVAVAGARTPSGGGRDVVYVVNAGDRSVAQVDAYTGALVRAKTVRGLTGPDVPALVARKVGIAKRGRKVTATIRFAGGRFERTTVAVVDADLADGHAEIELQQGAISTAVPVAERNGLTVRLLERPGRLRVLFSARRGRFTGFDVRPGTRGQAISVVATEPPPRRTTSVSTGGGYTSTYRTSTNYRTTQQQRTTTQRTTTPCIEVDGRKIC